MHLIDLLYSSQHWKNATMVCATRISCIKLDVNEKFCLVFLATWTLILWYYLCLIHAFEKDVIFFLIAIIWCFRKFTRVWAVVLTCGLQNHIFYYTPEVELALNLLHLNISMHILHNVVYRFPTILMRRICLSIQSFLKWWSFPLFW